MKLNRIWDNLFGLGTAAVTPSGMEGDSIWYVIRQGNIDFPFTTNFQIFRRIAPLRAIIERKAELFSNAQYEIVRTDTNEYEVDTDHELNEVLENPNLFQSWRQMLYMISIYKSIAGVAFVYPSFGISRVPSRLVSLKNIDFADYMIDENQMNNTIQSSKIEEIISEIRFTMDNGKVLVYNKPEELLIFKDSYSSYVKNYSRITTLLPQIENIWKATVAKGELLDKKGGIGIISGNQKDGGVAVPMKPETKKELQKKVDSHGFGAGRNNIMVTDVPLKFQHTVFDVQQLQLSPGLIDDFNICCDTYGVSRESFNGSTTFANKEQADKMTYNNVIISEWSDFFSLLNKGLNMNKEKRKIRLKTDHISALAKNKKDEVETAAKQSAMLLAELEKGIIDETEYRQQMGYES